jgi:hypothetical protein
MLVTVYKVLPSTTTDRTRRRVREGRRRQYLSSYYYIIVESVNYSSLAIKEKWYKLQKV